MELSWSTFILEIINFLVLVWILKRFLYRPVLNVLEKRREKIAQTLNEATERQTQAVALEKQYQGRLDEWELEKQQARESLQQEIQTEKNRRLEQLQNELTSERKKAAVLDARQQSESLKHVQHTAHKQAAKFASKILIATAGPEQESRLFDLFMNELEKLSDDNINRLRDACTNSECNIIVTSAYPLSKDQQQQLTQLLSTLYEQPITISYSQDTNLIAGLRVTMGAWVLHLNLQDELTGFVELSHEKLID